MPAKYRCAVCSRRFIHNETLTEHKLLHELGVLDGNTFCCPVCRCPVACRSGVHQLSKTCPSTRSLSSAVDRTNAEERVSARQTKEKGAYSDDGHGSTHIMSKAGALRVRLKGMTAKPKERPSEADETNSSRGISCKICKKSFVYQKCLRRHTAVVHGFSSGARYAVETKSNANDKVENATKSSSDEDSPTVKNEPRQHENCESDNEGMDSLVPEDDASSPKSKSAAKKPFDSSPRAAEMRSSVADLSCNMCSKVFKHRTMLLRHVQVVHDAINYEKCTCSFCSQEFTSQWTFSKHFETVHKTMADRQLSTLVEDVCSSAVNGADDGIAWCRKCRQWFTHYQSFLRHCGLKHRGDPQFKFSVEECDKVAEFTDHPDVEENIKQSEGSPGDHIHSEFSNTVHGVQTNRQNGVPANKELSDNEVNSDAADPSSKYSCSFCNRTFASVAFLDRHVRIKHSSTLDESADFSANSEFKARKQTFVCGQCSEEFREENALAEHIEVLHENTSHDGVECSCPICGCSCPNQSLFSMHYDTVHCATSALYAPSSMAVLEATNDVVRRCRACELWFTSDAVLQTHHCAKRTPVRQPPKTGRARYRCKLCGEAFEILRRFLHHRKVKHRVVGPDQTDPMEMLAPPPADLSLTSASETVNEADNSIAQFTRGRPPKQDSVDSVDGVDDDNKDDENAQNESDALLKPRMPRGYARKVSSDGAANLKCPECSRPFTTVAQLRRHRKSEHRNRTCQLCGVTCKSADMVYYHNLKYHHEQKCEACGASCSGRLGLIDHYRNEHPSEPPPLINRKTLICEYCPRVFAGCASRLLRDHIESCHLGRVHLCDVCGKRLGSAQTLAVHRRMHDPVARFECRECSRRFPHNTNLVNHIRKHHPERLPAKYVREFRCDVCSMQFGSSSGLSRHKSEKHGSQRHQCDLCLRVFQSMAGLRLHKRRDHQPKDPSPSLSPTAAVSAPESLMPPPTAAPPVVAQFTADQTSAIMAGFMANMIGLPSLGVGQTFQ